MSRTSRWDPVALRTGALMTAVIAVPASFVALWARSNASWTLTAIASLIALAGFVFGAALAAWLQPYSLPLAHGLLTALGTYIAAQVVLAVVRLSIGDGIELVPIFFNATLAALAGLVGGAIGGRVRRVAGPVGRATDVHDDRTTGRQP